MDFVVVDQLGDRFIRRRKFRELLSIRSVFVRILSNLKKLFKAYTKYTLL